MTPHFLKWSFGPKIESVDGICQQTDSRNRFYLDVKTGPYSILQKYAVGTYSKYTDIQYTTVDKVISKTIILLRISH